jgi:pimeloyl-ACP methyl ester carboxylesterase
LRNEALHLAHQLQDAPGAMHLVAHGYGAAVALHFALLQPTRVGSLTLYEPTLFHVLRDGVDTPAEIAVGTALQHAVQRRYESGDLAGAAWVFHDYWSGEGAWQALPSEVQSAIAARMPKVAAELHAVMTEATPLRGYAELAMPVLLMQGERTRRTPRRIVQRLAGALPRAAVLDVTGADHLGAVTQPRVMCQLVDAFLWSRHASGEARRYGAVTSRHARAIDSIHTAPILPGIGGSRHP